jgi:hypothetical protein
MKQAQGKDSDFDKCQERWLPLPRGQKAGVDTHRPVSSEGLVLGEGCPMTASPLLYVVELL